MLTLGTFKIRQKDELRIPANLPKVVSNINNKLRKIEKPSYDINLQAMPREYNVKFDVDTGDPANWSEGPPQTTAKAWSIYDCKRQLMLHSKNQD